MVVSSEIDPFSLAQAVVLMLNGLQFDSHQIFSVFELTQHRSTGDLSLKLTTHLCPVPRMRGAILPLPHAPPLIEHFFINVEKSEANTFQCCT
jgi:hypothetical protein